MPIMENYSIEMNGKIYGKTNTIEEAKKFANILGEKAIVFYKRIVVYPI